MALITQDRKSWPTVESSLSEWPDARSCGQAHSQGEEERAAVQSHFLIPSSPTGRETGGGEKPGEFR